ncbi:MAG: VOC family protein [Candidatus Dormibacteria bacterium]
MNWSGIKTSEFEAGGRFFTEVIGLDITYQSAGFAVVQLPDGDRLEIFGPEAPDPELQFGQNPVVAGFWVGDINRARTEVAKKGAELIGTIHGTEGEYQGQHFRSPDSKGFELCSDRRRHLTS